MADVRFETVVGAEDGGTFIEVPLDLPALFGRVRARVRVTVNDHTYARTVMRSGDRYYLPLSRANRAAFDGAAVSHRREWVQWVTEAKRPETRERRIGRVVEQVRGRA